MYKGSVFYAFLVLMVMGISRIRQEVRTLSHNLGHLIGFDPSKIVRLGQIKAEKAWDAIWEQVDDQAFVFALGNAGHGGLDVARLFRSRRS